MPARPLATKDNAVGRLNAGISAGTLTIPLQAGQGALFPTPKNGSATSGGTGILLNSTGIAAKGVAIGDIIENVTDGSYCVVRSVAADSIGTTPLVGGTDNTWQNSDVWAIDRFVATLIQYDTDGTTVLKREKALIKSISTDTLTVETGGRGYDSSTAQSFDADDYLYLLWTSVGHNGLKKMLADIVETVTANSALAALDSAVIKKDGTVAFTGDQSMGSHKITNLTDPTSNQDAATKYYADSKAAKFGGDGSDGALNVTSGTTTLDFASAAILEKNYTSFNISAGATLAFSNPYTYGSVFIGRSQTTGTVAGTLDLSAMGAAGGAAATGATDPGSGGRLGNSGAVGSDALQPTSTTIGGNLGTGGGGSTPAVGVGGALRATIPVNIYSFFKINNKRVGFAMPGGGGASGGAGGNANRAYGANGDAGTGTAGSRGGGGFILEFNGNCTLSGTLKTNGAAGSNGGTAANKDMGGGGAGGGGGGGRGVVLYAGTLSDTAAKTVNGGAAGTGGNNGPTGSWNTQGYGGGGGGGGASCINTGAAGSNGASSSTASAKTGGDSGAGGNGEIEVVKVQG
jgi:hypothetical protein